MFFVVNVTDTRRRRCCRRPRQYNAGGRLAPVGKLSRVLGRGHGYIAYFPHSGCRVKQSFASSRFGVVGVRLCLLLDMKIDRWCLSPVMPPAPTLLVDEGRGLSQHIVFENALRNLLVVDIDNKASLHRARFWKCTLRCWSAVVTTTFRTLL